MHKLALFLAEGFEEIEGLTVVDVCRRCGLEIDTVSINDCADVLGSHGIPVRADRILKEISFDDYDMLILPGGKKGTENLESCEPLKEALKHFAHEGKYIGAICAAPTILGHMGLLRGRKATCYPGLEHELEGAIIFTDNGAVTDPGGDKYDAKFITGRGMGKSIDFALAIATVFAGPEKAYQVGKAIVYYD